MSPEGKRNVRLGQQRRRARERKEKKRWATYRAEQTGRGWKKVGSLKYRPVKITSKQAQAAIRVLQAYV